MKKVFAFILICSLFVGVTAFTETKPTVDDKIEWLTLEQAFAKNQQAPRKILIDVYTDWCGWCKKMDKGTFADPNVVKYVNEHYYAVKLDAESTAPMKIGETKYEFDASKRTHQAAVALLQGRMSYPTIVYLDETFNMIQPIPGYMEAPQFHQIITFLGGDYHKKLPFEQYKESTYKEVFKGAF